MFGRWGSTYAPEFEQVSLMQPYQQVPYQKSQKKGCFLVKRRPRITMIESRDLVMMSSDESKSIQLQLRTYSVPQWKMIML